MKKTKAKKKKLINSFLCLLLCLVFGLGGVLFSGCWLEDEYNKAYVSFYEQYIAGFNTVYANSETQQRQIVDNLNDMIEDIIEGMSYNYGNCKDPDPTKPKQYAHGEVFPDSIRMLVYEDSDDNVKIADKTKQTLTPTTDITKFLSWNWNFLYLMKDDEGTYVNKINNLTPKESEKYEDWETRLLSGSQLQQRIDKGSYVFPQYMQDIMKIALYEILLGYEPTKIEVTIGKAPYTVFDKKEYEYSVKIESSPNGDIEYLTLYKNFTLEDLTNSYDVADFEYYETSEAWGKIKEYIAKLSEEYKSTTLYTGLTKQNADILINYILKEIIGEEAVDFDYKNFRNSDVNFRDYVSTIAYLIYSQSYDGSGDTWTYNYTSSKDSSVKISYTFSVGERARAMSAKLMSETAMDASWFNYNSSSPENSKIYTEVQAGFSARPATFVRYYEGEKLFGDFDAVDQFSGKPYAEYQSIVVDPKVSEETLPSQGLELECGFCFNFMSKNKDLKIATKIRYYIYDEETGTGKLYEFDGDTIDFVSGANTFKNSAGETCYENDFEFSIDTAELEKLDPTLVRHEVQENDPNACYYTVPFFKNSEIIQKAKESELSLSSEDASKIARLYKVIESEKGYGGLTVLDEKKVKSSFFEIVLDVIKSPEDENTDYNFSLVVSGTLLNPGIY
ncbi:MAG: hypothetical protein ACI4L1_03920 [Christensenellales bacterium]